MPTYTFYIVDVFTEEQFAGNQLAVVLGNPSSDLMQQITREMNYSETTFITKDTPINDGWDVRIFTMTAEVPFAGHPTLGTAFVISEMLDETPSSLVNLNLLVGQIPVTFADDDVLWMRQNLPVFGEIVDAETMAAAINLPVDAFDTRYPIQVVSTGLPSIICPLKSRDVLNAILIDTQLFQQLLDKLAVPHLDALMAFCPEPVHEGHDLHARMLFQDSIGVKEDPATGSANGNLAGWLARHRYFDTAQMTATVEQGYMVQRPSLLRLKADDTGETITIDVGGRVRLVAKGELYVD